MKARKTRSTGNVFSDLGFPKAQAENLKLRSDLLIDLQQAITKRRLKQAEVAKILGITQPRVSDLMRGRLELFSIDTLVNLLGRLGIEVKLIVKSRNRRRAKSHNAARNLRAETGARLARVLLRSGGIVDQQGA